MKNKLNLIPREFIEEESLSKIQKNITYGFLALILIIFVLSIADVISTVSLKREKIRLEAQKNSVESLLANVNQKILAQQSSVTQPKVEDPFQVIAIQTSAQQEWWILLNDFGRTVPPPVTLTLLEITERPGNVKELKVAGVAAEYFSLPNFLLNLQKLPVKGDFQLSKTSKVEKGKGITFEIKGVFK